MRSEFSVRACHILCRARNMPSLDLVMKIMNKFPDINPEWLVMGNGQMIKSTQIDLFEEETMVEQTKTEPF